MPVVKDKEAKNMRENEHMELEGKQNYDFNNPAVLVMTRRTEMEQRRKFFNPIWRENDYAYQAILFQFGDSSGIKRQFDSSIAPELQQSYYGGVLAPEGFSYSDFRYPLEHAVIIRKMKEEVKNVPRPQWTTLGETKLDKATLFTYIFDYECYKMNLDDTIYNLLLKKNIFGTSIAWVYPEVYEVQEQIPSVSKDGVLSWKTVTYKRRAIRVKDMDLRHVLIDEGANRIEDAEDCIITEYYSVNKFKQVFKDCDIWKKDDAGNPTDELRFEPQRKMENYQYSNDQQGHNLAIFIRVDHYYNCVKDQYILSANDVAIKEEAIPAYPGAFGKMLPLVMFYDHKLAEKIYGMGECVLVKPFREIKNKCRNIIFDVTKKQAKPTLIIDPMSMIDMETFEFGMDIIKGNPKDVGQIQINANLEWVYKLDEQTTEDVIFATGININDIGQSGPETATKTAVRRESQLGVVELGLTCMESSFKRLYLLIKDCIRLYKRVEDYNPITGKTVPNRAMVKNKQVFKNVNPETGEMNIAEEPSDIATYFEYTAEDLDDDFDCISEIGNIALTKEIEKENQEKALEFGMKYAPQEYDARAVVSQLNKNANLPETLLLKGSNQNQIMPQEQDTPESVLSRFGLAATPDRVKAKEQMGQAQMMKDQQQNQQMQAALESQGQQPMPVNA